MKTQPPRLKKHSHPVKVAPMIRHTPLARYRFEHDLSLRELAQQASSGGIRVTKQTLSRIEKGTHAALPILARISRVTGLSGDDLLAGGEGG